MKKLLFLLPLMFLSLTMSTFAFDGKVSELSTSGLFAFDSMDTDFGVGVTANTGFQQTHIYKNFLDLKGDSDRAESLKANIFAHSFYDHNQICFHPGVASYIIQQHTKTKFRQLGGAPSSYIRLKAARVLSSESSLYTYHRQPYSDIGTLFFS